MVADFKLVSPVFLPGPETAGHAVPPAKEWILMGVSVTVAAAGLLLAWDWYARKVCCAGCPRPGKRG